MVPGLDVAQIDASKWAISARGFNGQYSNKLLVLIDGRAVYSPIFAGVFWDSENVPLDSIDRIEVIRGPGAAAWGSNAVNGVINIITLERQRHRGWQRRRRCGQRHHRPNDDSLWRKGPRHRSLSRFCRGLSPQRRCPRFAGLDGHDDARLIHGGFRTDTNLSAKDSLTTEGEIYQGNAGELAFIPLSLMSAGKCNRGSARPLLRRKLACEVESHFLAGIHDISPVLFRPHQSWRYHLQHRPEYIRHRLSTSPCLGSETRYRLGAWLPCQYG